MSLFVLIVVGRWRRRALNRIDTYAGLYYGACYRTALRYEVRRMRFRRLVHIMVEEGYRPNLRIVRAILEDYNNNV